MYALPMYAPNAGWVAGLDHTRPERVVGRVAALAHRTDVEELKLVLGRAWDRLGVLTRIEIPHI